MKLVNYAQFAFDMNERGIAYAAAHSAALGFEAVEYLDLDEARPRTVEQANEERRILRQNGLEVACYSMLVDLWGCDEAAVMEKLDYIAALGTPLLHHTLLPQFARTADSPDFEQALARVLPRAAKIAARAEALGMSVIYEPQGLYFNGPLHIERFLKEMKALGHNVGFCADFGNPLFVDADPVACAAHLLQSVRHVHIKDYTLGEREIPELEGYWLENGKRLTVTPLGTGVVDVKGALALLHDAGYDGTVALEFLAGDAEMKRSIAYVKENW